MVLKHRVDGDGPPLVLLNGGFMSIAAWEPFAVSLASSHRVIRCDFRGQFLTPGPYPLSLDEHARDVLALLDALGVRSAHVAGASFGAEVAMLVAARAPDRVDRLTVITATERTTERMRRDAGEVRALAEEAAAGRREAAERMFRRVLGDTWSAAWLAQQPPDFVEARIQQLVLLPEVYFAGAAALLRLLETLDLTPDLGGISAPTLVIGGEEDQVFPPEHSHAIAEAIPNARLEMIAGTGHGLLMERAARVVELLRA